MVVKLEVVMDQTVPRMQKLFFLIIITRTIMWKYAVHRHIHNSILKKVNMVAAQDGLSRRTLCGHEIKTKPCILRAISINLQTAISMRIQ